MAGSHLTFWLKNETITVMEAEEYDLVDGHRLLQSYLKHQFSLLLLGGRKWTENQTERWCRPRTMNLRGADKGANCGQHRKTPGRHAMPRPSMTVCREDLEISSSTWFAVAQKGTSLKACARCQQNLIVL